MKPLRIAVVAVLLAVITIGVLGTPWVQVVEEHSAVLTLTGSATYEVVFEAKNLVVPPLGYWQSDLFNLFELEQGQRVEIRVKPRGSSPLTLYVDLLRDAGREWNITCDFLVWHDQVLPSGELFGPEQGEDCIAEEGKYLISLFNSTSNSAEIDLRLLASDLWVSTTTTTWYNTTYKRPL